MFCDKYWLFSYVFFNLFNVRCECNRRSFLLTECKEWWFGDNCSQQCVGYCRDNNTCNHVTGQCNRGCDAGWTGDMCKKGEFLTAFYVWYIFFKYMNFTCIIIKMCMHMSNIQIHENKHNYIWYAIIFLHDTVYYCVFF